LTSLKQFCGAIFVELTASNQGFTTFIPVQYPVREISKLFSTEERLEREQKLDSFLSMQINIFRNNNNEFLICTKLRQKFKYY